MRFLLGTSYFSGGKGGAEFRSELMRHWFENVARADVKPERVVVICENDSVLPVRPNWAEIISLPGDLGYVGAHLSGEKNYEFTGWSASMIALASLAYLSCCDLVFDESDNLMFGPCIGTMYRDLGDGCLIFGYKQKSPPHQECSQALFLCRHAFLPTFIRTYLGLGRDGDVRFIGEKKFKMIEDRFGGSLVRRLTFGQDRERPIDWGARPLYVQQWTPEELQEAKQRGMV